MKQSLFAQRISKNKELQNKDGFPQTFKISPNLEMKAKMNGISLKEQKQIEEENAKAIQQLSPEEITSMQQQLRNSLSEEMIRIFENGQIHQQFRDNVNQNIVNNMDYFNKHPQYDEDIGTLSKILELIKSPELSAVKIALSLISQIIKPKNVLQLEEMRITEYLIDTIKSTNLSIAIQGFDNLYNYWTTIVPECWSLVYSIYSGDPLDLYPDLEKSLQNIKHNVNFDQIMDLYRICNILCRKDNIYTTTTECSDKLKLIILNRDYDKIKQLNILDYANQLNSLKSLLELSDYLEQSQFNQLLSLSSSLKEGYLKQQIINKYNTKFMCNLPKTNTHTQIQPKKYHLHELQFYEIIPFQSELIQVDLSQLLNLIFEVKFEAQSIISRKLRRICKSRILNIIREVYKDQLKSNTIEQELIRQQLKIVLVVQEQEQYLESPLLQSMQCFLKLKEGFELYIDNCADLPFHGEYFMLRFLKLILRYPVRQEYYDYLLGRIDLKRVLGLLSKNVSYFERLLQKCTYDSYFNTVYVNVLFLFGSKFCNPDFRRMLRQEFETTPILEHMTYRYERDLFDEEMLSYLKQSK